MRVTTLIPILLAVAQAAPGVSPLARRQPPPKMSWDGVDCTPTSDPIDWSSKWDEWDIEDYLIRWFDQVKRENAGKQSLQDFQGDLANFPTLFANYHDADFAAGCDFQKCVSSTCTDFKTRNVDPRAFVIIRGIQNAQSRFRALGDLVTGSAFQSYLKDMDRIYEVITKESDIFEPDEKVLSGISVAGAALGGLSAIPHVGPFIGLVSAALSSLGAAGELMKRTKRAYDPDDVKKSIRDTLANTMSVYRDAAEEAFVHGIFEGRIAPTGSGLRPAATLDWESGKGLSGYLRRKEFWEPLGSISEKSVIDTMSRMMNRLMLNDGLKATRHFVVKNEGPGKDKLDDSWKKNCEKLAGGWADAERGICWSLQKLRSSETFPFADFSTAGDDLKVNEGAYGISLGNMGDFYRSVEACYSSCDQEFYCSGVDPEQSAADWFSDKAKAASGNPSGIAPCAFNLAVLTKGSVCAQGSDVRFPWNNFDVGKCTPPVRGDPFSQNEDNPGLTSIDFIYGTNAGKYECGKSQEAAAPGLQTIACSNGEPPKDERRFTPGWCGVHITQFQKPDPSKDSYKYNVKLFDGAGEQIGEGNDRIVPTGKTTDVFSRLPHTFVVTSGAVDDDAVYMAYADQRWGSNDQGHHCNFGAYDSGKREGDCGFTC